MLWAQLLITQKAKLSLEKTENITLSFIENLLNENPQRIHKIIVDNEAINKKLLKILTLSKKNNIPSQRLKRNVFRKKFPHAKSGIFVILDDIAYKTQEEFLNNAKNFKKVFLFDGIEDPHNLGAVSRSLYYFGIDAFVLPYKRSAPLNKGAIRASAGALLKYRPYRVSSLIEAIKILKKYGFTLYGATEKAENTILEEDFPEKTAIVFGKESKGISSEVRKNIDKFIKIPEKNRFNSLNLSVSASIFAFFLSFKD